MSISAAQLLYGPVLVFMFVYKVVFVLKSLSEGLTFYQTDSLTSYIAGLGLVQRAKLLPRPLHGPGQLRHAGRVRHVRRDHEQRWVETT